MSSQRSKTTPKAIAVVFGLGFLAVLTPIFVGYGLSLMAFLWLMRHQWRVLPDSHDSREFVTSVQTIFRPIDLGVVILLVSVVMSAVISNFGPEPLPWSKVVSKNSHYFLKYGLLWFVLSRTGLAVAASRYNLSFWSKIVLGWVALYLVYVVVQRYTGINWVHGFDAKLGEHRFAYGVFRPSGFFGHPLTFSYNLGLLLLAFFGLAFSARRDLDRAVFRRWVAATLIAALMTFLTGSRFPLGVILLTLVIGYFRFSKRSVFATLGLGALLGVGLVIEGSIVGRFLELFQGNAGLAEAFPRVIFWQVHWQVFLDHPIGGAGIVHISNMLPGYYNATGYSDKIYTAHNIYLQFLADSGVIGFSGLIALLVGSIVSGLRLKNLIGDRSLLDLTLFALISGLMQNVYRDSEFLFAFWILTAILVTNACRGLLSRTERNERDERKQN